ncbi:hypothetical protein JOQ06_029699, partial [Pogonophryne albipinna]
MSTWGILRNDFHRYDIPHSFIPPSCCFPPTRLPPPNPHSSPSPFSPPHDGDDVRSSISQPGAGDDMGNLACEFSPALDMVTEVQLSAPTSCLKGLHHMSTAQRKGFWSVFTASLGFMAAA